ncbi:MAG: response regulator [Pseudomonadota bacterium]
MSRRLGSLEVVLISITGLYQASDEVSDVEFSTLSTELLRPYPFIRSIMSIRVIKATERDRFEQEMQDRGYIQFRISELAQQERLIPANSRPDYLPIVLIEPLDPRLGQLLGYDAQSKPDLSTAISDTVRTSKIAASPPVRLLRNREGLFAFKARYQGRYTPRTEGERLAMLDGIIAAEVDPKALLEGLVSIPNARNILLQFPGAAADMHAFRNAGVQEIAAAGLVSYLPVFTFHRVLDVYGQPAVLEITQQASIKDISVGWLLMAMISPIVPMLAITLAWRNQRLRQRREQEIEETIRNDERRFKNVVENAFDAIVTTDQNGKIITWNRQAERMFGWRREELIGKPMPSRIFPAETYLEKPPDRFKSSKEQLISDRIETTAQHRDGTSFPVEMAISVAPHGERIEQSAFIHDIRVRKGQEIKLQQAKEAAEAGSRAKSEFLATMSHEIRTPMNGVLGMTELLLGSELTGKQWRYADTAHRSGQMLLDVINNILDFSKIEANKLRLAQSPFDLQKIVEDVLQMVAEQAREKHLELLSDISAGINSKVIGDGPRLRQVLINLVGNAVKFTEQGEIVICINPVEENSGRILLSFEVRDSGIGIDADKLAGIFDVFTQADGSVTRRYGGTGLGLAISRQLVTLMDGEIEVESKKGEGSTFHFTARFGKQTQVREPIATPLDQFMGSKVLVVDDNRPTRSLLLKKFKDWGLQTADADCGDKALRLLQEAATDGKPYALAILDRMMPGMDGITLARKIKADPRTTGTRLLMYSAMHEEAGDTVWREAGIGAYLSKPARLSELHDQLLSLLGENPSKEDETGVLLTETAEAAEAAQYDCHILLVEDNPVNQLVALDMLERFCERIDVAENGQAAVKYMSANGYDLILMDCHMPEMDGFVATKAIRSQEPKGSHVPIIALTADVQKGVQEQCRAAGMDDYLSKPFNQDVLQAKLEKWLTGKEREHPTST